MFFNQFLMLQIPSSLPLIIKKTTEIGVVDSREITLNIPNEFP